MLKVLMPSLKELVSSDYNTIKTQETERLIAESLSGFQSSDKPVLLQVSGIPGSGKSTFCSKNQPKDFLYLSFDRIMTKLSGYQQELQENGAELAYRKYEMPARIIGYEILCRAINLHINIMFEHSGTNQAHLELFKNIADKGYRTVVDFIMCDTKLAIKRAREREKKINRHVPEQLIIERAERFSEYITAYKKLTNEVFFFDGADNFKPLNKI